MAEDKATELFKLYKESGDIRIRNEIAALKEKICSTEEQITNTETQKEVSVAECSGYIDELNNLKLKPTGVQNQFKVERISRSIEKDRFSSLEYALYRVRYYEDKATKHATKKNIAQYIRFSPRKRG